MAEEVVEERIESESERSSLSPTCMNATYARDPESSIFDANLIRLDDANP
jgi:hypothetical protein